ncbi:epoxide hydrolase family protein [Hymenobacter convexus]|uniref:epoxide hydrolase family protein n=1 Tax=Hymenobacter sp. CA1UV-4 TaxID=3063782 RepID=UPI0027131918|nr:epoxide hydrolase family protein [Hymenobacter sp. CA1UV-4]MDO7852087.1 epoxide hydrolase [Hymenobacter sp. CA1UV-4]
MQPFRIDVAQSVLDDLQTRLARTRWPDEIEGAGWDYGTNRDYIQELTGYWQRGYDWRTQEALLNKFAHFRAEVDGTSLHFIQEPGRGPSPMPLLLTHGWPDSFYRMHKLIPLLTDPASHGGRAEDAFTVVVPSIPGFGFSDKPTRPGCNPVRIAELFAQLMTETLGHARYGAHGGDWGSSITEQLARRNPEALLGIHLTDIPFMHLFTVKEPDLTPPEEAYLKAGKAWQMSEGAYALIQSTKPQTLAYGLNDSPVGLLGWIVEKFQRWSDSGGQPERAFSRDELLTNVMIYWVTETINSANRLYYETQHHPAPNAADYCAVPTGVALFPKDLMPAPRAFAERFFNVQRWSEMPHGGHFAALEAPELLAEELRAFFRPLRAAAGA